MLFYRVLLEAPASGVIRDSNHWGTLAEAHTSAKGYAERDCVWVELIDVPTDKAGILDLLRGYSPQSDIKPQKTWRLSQRGALVDAENREL